MRTIRDGFSAGYCGTGPTTKGGSFRCLRTSINQRGNGFASHPVGLVNTRKQPSMRLPKNPLAKKKLNPKRTKSVCCKAATTPAVPSHSIPSDVIPELSEIALKQLDPSQKSNEFDLIIAGGGPSGLAVASRVSESGFSVCVVDPAPLSGWPNNYGVWVDEFEAMGLADCLEVVWPRANVFVSNEGGERFLNRPYGRIDRPKLKRRLLEKCVQEGVTFYEAKVSDVDHGGASSTVVCSTGVELNASLVVDATGHARKLVKYTEKFDPGYQGAYGYFAEVESHPFDLDTMLFMDWRDCHTKGNPEMAKRNKELPTFLYAMPFSKTRVFLEETSLVARPAVPFDDLKERLEARLKYMGIKVKSIEEEEYCLIPMGGVLPKIPQRVLGIGGTAGMVHPSTGYMIARMLGAAPLLADAIIEQLSSPHDKATHMGMPKQLLSATEAEVAATEVWKALWPTERIWQREFFNFGMEIVLKLDLEQTRAFFSAFFTLSDYHWQGFLSSRLSFTELIIFGWALFLNSSNETRLGLLGKGIPGLITMIARLSFTVIE